ncbi:Hpr(Ser) kinase/phosphatase [Rhodoferax ferrireducens T118]|uniref:Hpr(Ser) kinase/phosphatase n=1 Tax=Albidiferax ferrireducens (strain ATCC BAA-621 / DSM 15236 / T118) TaxID=338969 RepID=Q220U4_ALBFT|nr:HprK-related kinase A [Rhodoferax ferrireducens]ABD68459.1 Hpr(Ser) kinase/phosphatase [Rhodoferax ferrireducens T118]
MKISEVPLAELARLLRCGDLLLRLTPFVARVASDVPSLAQDIALMYADFAICPPDGFADFHVQVWRDSGVRRWFKPQARFSFDGQPSFTGLPVAQAFAMLEWGLNWCVAAHSHQYLVIHAAVIEKDGKAVVLPAPPGSGKSTLCAGLVMKGWRLLSDELALYELQTGLIYGMARPISLKNKSIDIIQHLAPDAVMTAPVPDTTKGTIALLRPSVSSVMRVKEPVQVTWIVLPNYVPGSPPILAPHSRARTFMLLAEQSFNYDIQGQSGFDAITALVGRTRCYQFTYSSLDDAQRVFDNLLQGQVG